MSTSNIPDLVYFPKSPPIMYHLPMAKEDVGINLDALEWAMSKKKKWNLATLSKESGVNKSTITLLFQGKVQGITAANVAKLARALEVSTDFLMGLTGTPDQRPEMDLAIAEIVAIAKTLSEFRQRDLLLVAQAYQDADDPTPEMMEKILEVVEEVAGAEVREKLAASLASRRPPPDGSG